MAKQKPLLERLRASLIGADGEAYTPPAHDGGLGIKYWGQQQSIKNMNQASNDWWASVGKPGHTSFLPPHLTRPDPFSEWAGFGEVMAGRRRAIEDAGGNARIANPIMSRPGKLPVANPNPADAWSLGGSAEPSQSYEYENTLGYGKGGETPDQSTGRRRQNILDYFDRRYGKLK